MTLQKLVALVALCAVATCVSSARAQEAPLVAPLVLANGDSPAWGAGSLDAEHLRDGRPSRLWEHGKASSIAINTVPEDWSAYNHLTFWLHSRQATGAKFMLVLSSENPATEGADYYSAPITVNFMGWKRFRYGLANLGTAREPLGWKKIGGVLFTATGWGNEPNPQTVVSIGPVVLSQEGKTKGPRMSDTDLFESLDLTFPGLEAVAAAYKKGDVPAAKHALAEYYRRRANPRWYFRPARWPTLVLRSPMWPWPNGRCATRCAASASATNSGRSSTGALMSQARPAPNIPSTTSGRGSSTATPSGTPWRAPTATPEMRNTPASGSRR
jgi:hypothetical protein